MGARRAWLAATLVVLVSGVTVPARAVQPADTEARAALAAARITRATTEFRHHSAAAAAAAARLSSVFGHVAAADEAAAASGGRAARARSELAARTLALYAYGAGVRAELALLTAPTPEDALWRLEVGTSLGERLIVGAAREQRAADTAASTDDATAASAQAAAAELAQALGRLREAETAARAALDGAKAELRRLDVQTRRERAAREAAAALARAQDSAAAARLAADSPPTALGIPSEFERAYRAAAVNCPMRWTLLAAVGQVESGHGRNNGPSSAGAIGPMQFMPATFAAYGVDGDGDGEKTAWDPQDAIFSAANYLCASGAGGGPDGERKALFAYNHAQWYVELVLATEQAILRRATA